MILTLIIKSKHKKSFLIYLFVLCLVFNKINVIKKLINKNNFNIKFALLKSPNINKIAQQHFGFKIYKIKLFIFLNHSIKFILLAKLFIWKLFDDIYNSVNYCLLRKIKVIVIKHYFTYFNFEILRLNNKIKNINKMIQILNFICFKILLKKLIAQWQSIRLINEMLTVQFCFS